MSDELTKELNRQKDEIEKANKELQGKYRHLFVSSEIGLDVLSDILVNFCHFGCFIYDNYDMAQHNVGVSILSRIGLFTPENRKNVMMAMVNAIPTPKKEE